MKIIKIVNIIEIHIFLKFIMYLPFTANIKTDTYLQQTKNIDQ